MKRFFLLLPLAAIAGCSGTLPPITNNPNPAPDIISVLDPQGQLKSDLIGTAQNLDGATAIGIIPPTLPAAACQHDINQFLGVETNPNAPAVQSFQPVNDGPISLGSIAFIEYLKFQAMSGSGITIPQDCYTIIGYFMVQNAATVLKVVSPVPPPIVISPMPAGRLSRLVRPVASAPVPVH